MQKLQSICKVCTGISAARLWKSRLKVSVQTQYKSHPSLWRLSSRRPPSLKTRNPYNPHCPWITAVNQGMQGCHWGHCPQTPIAKAFPRQEVSGRASPSLGACLCTLRSIWKHIFLTMERAAKNKKLYTFSRLGKHPELLLPFHPITNHWKQLFLFFFHCLIPFRSTVSDKDRIAERKFYTPLHTAEKGKGS